MKKKNNPKNMPPLQTWEADPTYLHKTCVSLIEKSNQNTQSIQNNLNTFGFKGVLFVHRMTKKYVLDTLTRDILTLGSTQKNCTYNSIAEHMGFDPQQIKIAINNAYDKIEDEDIKMLERDYQNLQMRRRAILFFRKAAEYIAIGAVQYFIINTFL
jgi:hypothetical protein